MNKQEIEKAIQWHKEVLNLYEFERATYEDTCGTGDLTEEEREEVYNDLDERINMFKESISALQQQLTNGWIPVSSGKLPSNEVRVFICADRKYHDGKITQIRAIAMYEDGTLHTEDSGFNWEESDFDFDYDEETADYIIPEGWWEQNMYSEEFGRVDDFVTHWMPLPKQPKEATK
jgi:hypothetical protein